LSLKSTILLQLDADRHPSVFDAIVAIDSGVDHLLQYHDVAPGDVRELIHGAIFTRGMDELKRTAVFIGGADVPKGEELMQRVLQSFFGPMRVSVMMDTAGANTTAVAAVLSAWKGLSPTGMTAVVIGATGAVGQRIVRILARDGCDVRVGSRSLDRATEICRRLTDSLGNQAGARLHPVVADRPDAIVSASTGAQLLISAGAAGVRMIDLAKLAACGSIRLAMDLNAVPPAGIEGIEVSDKGVLREGIICYGAVGVGGLKMKVHRSAIRSLFEANDQILDVDELYQRGMRVAESK
jgi:methylenetetrahydrofolate/methylenetetrahydromethanopterin dehydrogenase (NADP+)